MPFIILAIALFSCVLSPLSAYYPTTSQDAPTSAEDDYDESEDGEEEEEDNI